MVPIKFAILTVSDTCNVDQSKDLSGPLLTNLVTNSETKSGQILQGLISYKAIVPDEREIIESVLKTWSSKPDVHVILTTGGTGFADRDITPEATKNVIEKEAPGITLAILMAGLNVTPMAMLSRLACGIRNKTLIINLPGSPKAVKESLEAIALAIPHALALTLGAKSEIIEAHKRIQCTEEYTSVNEKHITFLASSEETAGRLRMSAYPMISMEMAEKLIEEIAVSSDVEVVNVKNAFQRILREDVYSLCHLPPFRASVKDGYAILASDGKGRRKVLGRLGAGFAPGTMQLDPGTCVWVNTGAPVPDEATAVVQVEDTKLIKSHSSGEEQEIEILCHSTEGQDIRPIGIDIEKGALILKAHTKIDAAEMGLLAACGCAQVIVTKLPSVGVLSTGNELQDVGEPLKEGHVYDSNKITLMTMLQNSGYAPVDMGISYDKKDDTIRALRKSLDQVDVLVTTGSVSMGDKDLLKPILKKEFNAFIHFGRLNMKPGKPTTFATCKHNGKKKYILCLPGNPVSATVTAYLFVLPLLNRLNGNFSKPVILKAKVTSSYRLDFRPEFARVTLQWNKFEPYPKAYSTGNQVSSRLLSCKNANALLMLPEKTNELTEIEEGEVVDAVLLNFFQNVEKTFCD
ncbi:gephyrin isoform X2 [Belonocnema kinseyi]|uniref:gephyrin isoform X2 n=1 Tax=Belonocnema kinseyi TaxID=2817044 RepID=UPI00143D2078|nr:gephyrin isoform X2 [Belonocnema kinseyi]